MTGTQADCILGSRHAAHLTDLQEPREPLHSYVLLRTYRHQCERMRRSIGEADRTYRLLDRTLEALRQLMAVETFRALLKAEGFATISAPLAKRICGDKPNAPDAREDRNTALAANHELVAGICLEAIHLLEDCSVNPKIFSVLRRVVPGRQVEIAQIMIALDRVKFNCAKVFIALTPRQQLTDPSIPRQRFAGLSPGQLSAMEIELAELSQAFLTTCERLGSWGLELVAVRGYLNLLLDNVRIVRYLAHYFPQAFSVFQKMTDPDQPVD